MKQPKRSRWVFATIAVMGSLVLHPARTQVVRQITHHFHGGYQLGVGALDDAGAAVFATYNEDPLGTNPQHAWQLFKWTAAGAATQLTAALEGSSSVSVSDDGQWLAFISRADLVGQNHDESAELYVMRSDGTQLAQRTSNPDVLSAQIAGSGNRIVFSASTDPLGSNPQHLIQLFAVARDGTGLVQLTSLTELNALRYTPQIAVSDDGQRFAYTIQEFEGVAISGAGNRVARVSNGYLTSSNWDGSGSVQLDTGVASTVSLNDSGLFVYYAAYDGDNDEIFQIKASGGTPRIRLTNTQLPLSNRDPVVAGGGNRIAFTVTGGAYPGFSNPDGGPELMVMDSAGGNLHQLTNSPDSRAAYLEDPDLSADGTRVAFYGYPDHAIYRIQTDGTDLTNLVDLVHEFRPGGVSISSDGTQVAFATYDDLTGQNPAEEFMVFRVAADGAVVQLTPQGFDPSYHPAIPPDSSLVIFYGGNRLYSANLDGSNLQAVFMDPVNGFSPARGSAHGERIVYGSAITTGGQTFDQVSRYSAATGVQQLTSDPIHSSWYPDISADGQRIAYSSTSDPLGTNPDHDGCLFLVEPDAGTLRQMTPAGVSGLGARFSHDGRWIYFVSPDPVFEEIPGRSYEPYRVNVATGVIERVGGLRLWSSSPGSLVKTDATGTRAVYASVADPLLANQDGDWELFFIDFSTTPKIRVSTATPTVVSWDIEPSPVRYDVIRGDVANLGFGAGNALDLGPVVCVENDSPDPDTIGDEDLVAPSPGQTFFYLHRGSQGVLAGPGSYGQGTGGRERLAGAGGCAP